MNLEKFQLLQVSEESLKKFDIQVKNKSELITQINNEIFRKCARTGKEKFDVLDLRDKVLKLIRYEINNQTGSNESIVLIGSCQDMCPEKERYSREHLNLMSSYEIYEGQIEHGLMVKEYSRSSADQDLPLPNELRPANVLFETMLYIIDEVIAKIEANNGWLDESTTGDWYDFAWNRTRAIRKEINQQRLLLNEHKLEEGLAYSQDADQNEFIRNGLGGVTIIEQCARFHILCSYRLCDQGPRVFSFKINEDSIKNCFQSLRQYYVSSSAGNSNLVPSPHEPEFRSYVILLNLSQSDILSEILSWSPKIRNSPHVKFALAIYNAFNSRNYVQFFRLLKSNECSYLQACILHRYVSRMRCVAFKIIFTAFKDGKEKAYPASKIADLLGFDTPDDVFDYTDVFELDSDETNIIMRSTSSYSCFNMSKENEDRLKVRRSRLLVESKFKQNSMLTDKKCLSQIIRGEYVGNEPSSFGPDYQLSTVFDEQDYYCDTEINQLLEQVKPREMGNRNFAASGLKSILTPSKIAVRKAATLVKKAIGVKTNKVPGLMSLDGEDKAEAVSSKRRTSASSGSSTSSVGLRRKNSNKFADAIKTKAGKAEAPSGNLFTAIVKPEVVNPFSKLAAGKADNLATAIPKQTFWQTQASSTTAALPTTKEAPKNLFEHLITKNDQQDEKQRKEKQLNLKTESFFQSMLLEISRGIVNEFYQEQQTLFHLAFDVTDQFLSSFISSEVKQIYDEIVPVVKSYEQAERIQKQIEMQRKQESYLRMQREIFFSNEILDSLTSEMIKQECTSFLRTCCELERTIYDDLLCSVFQTEFDIILKSIAQEINNELTIDRLIKCVYFNNDKGLNNDDYGSNKSIDFGSIFMADLCSIMHDCVYETTRLNLNVNRELYYEIKQALLLNEKKHLFRKWRLKLSLRLLKSAHKRTSLDNKQWSQQSKQITPTKSGGNSIDRQLNLITFIKAYGVFMLNNLNRLQRVLTFMVRDEAADNVDESLNASIGSQCAIVHSEEYQMHLTWNININYRHFLYEILLENYFDIIHNRNDMVLLPPHVNQELFVKISVAMPKLNTDSEDMEAIKRWLLTKFFESGETSHVENLCVTQLQSNAYGLRFCSKLCTTGLTEAEFEHKLNRRDFYGTNALIFVLLPLEENEESYMYLMRMKAYLLQTLRLFNENLDVTDPNVIDSYQFMFVSYLESHEETKEVIQLILGKSNCCYCLLDGDVTKDNGTLQLTFQHFLKQVYRQTSKFNQGSNISPKKDQISQPKLNFEAINNVLTLASIYEMTLLMFFEYVTHSMKNIYLSFDALIDEYNARLEMLVRMLTREEYRQLAWPIPELCHSDLNKQSWILKYWNTTECFDNMIQSQFYHLMHLDMDHDMSDTVSLDDTEDVQVDFNLVESKFNKYLAKLLNRKRSAGLLSFAHSECTKSKYQLESSITGTIINMKKKTTVNSSTNTSTISKYDIQWTQLLLASVEYLLANGYLRFKNTKRLNLEQFLFYCNLNEIKAYDWINNAQNGQSSLSSSPASSVFSNQSDQQNYSNHNRTGVNKSNYLVNKYGRKIESSFRQTKRRISDDEPTELSTENRSLSSPIDQASLEETYHLGEMFLSSFDKRPKTQRLMSPPSQAEGNATEKPASFDDKFEEFMSLMNTERDKNEQFESKLTTCESNLEANDVFKAISFDFLDTEGNKNFDKPASDIDDPTRHLDALMDRLKEEKIKSEQFNSKLDRMLNF